MAYYLDKSDSTGVWITQRELKRRGKQKFPMNNRRRSGIGGSQNRMNEE
jgi:hypothetical protein